MEEPPAGVPEAGNDEPAQEGEPNQDGPKPRRRRGGGGRSRKKIVARDGSGEEIPSALPVDSDPSASASGKQSDTVTLQEAAEPRPTSDTAADPIRPTPGTGLTSRPAPATGTRQGQLNPTGDVPVGTVTEGPTSASTED